MPQLFSAEARVLWILLAFTLLRGVIYAVVNPPFSSPDEGSHFKYIAYLATGGESGDKGNEGHQPVPYYLLMAPAYWLTSEEGSAIQLLAIRLTSIVLLLGSVVFTWLSAKRLAPGKPFVPPVAAAIVALNPINTVIAASANNDNAANFMAAVLTFLVISLIAGQRPRWVATGLVVAIGAAIMTKGQILPIVAVAMLVLVVYAGSQVVKGRPQLLIPVIGGSVLVLWLAGMTEEGQYMLTRARRFVSVFTDFPSQVQITRDDVLEHFTYQFRGFWAQFAGDSIYPPALYYLLPSGVAAVGLTGYVVRGWKGITRGASVSRRALLLRIVLVTFVLAQFTAILLVYARNLIDETKWIELSIQGRYLMVMLPALALLIADGLSMIADRRKWSWTATAAVGALLVFDVIALGALLTYYAWHTGALL